MKIDKAQIIDWLRSRQEEEIAAQAEPELSEQVDTDQDAAMLAHLGIDPQELMSDLDRGGEASPG